MIRLFTFSLVFMAVQVRADIKVSTEFLPRLKAGQSYFQSPLREVRSTSLPSAGFFFKGEYYDYIGDQNSNCEGSTAGYSCDDVNSAVGLAFTADPRLQKAQDLQHVFLGEDLSCAQFSYSDSGALKKVFQCYDKKYLPLAMMPAMKPELSYKFVDEREVCTVEQGQFKCWLAREGTLEDRPERSSNLQALFAAVPQVVDFEMRDQAGCAVDPSGVLYCGSNRHALKLPMAPVAGVRITGPLQSSLEEITGFGACAMSDQGYICFHAGRTFYRHPEFNEKTKLVFQPGTLHPEWDLGIHMCGLTEGKLACAMMDGKALPLPVGLTAQNVKTLGSVGDKDGMFCATTPGLGPWDEKTCWHYEGKWIASGKANIKLKVHFENRVNSRHYGFAQFFHAFEAASGVDMTHLKTYRLRPGTCINNLSTTPGSLLAAELWQEKRPFAVDEFLFYRPYLSINEVNGAWIPTTLGVKGVECQSHQKTCLNNEHFKIERMLVRHWGRISNYSEERRPSGWVVRYLFDDSPVETEIRTTGAELLVLSKFAWYNDHHRQEIRACRFPIRF